LFCAHAEHTKASSLRSDTAVRGAADLDAACAQRASRLYVMAEASMSGRVPDKWVADN
jgi:hypothetical protein